jgi:hypothetical protein
MKTLLRKRALRDPDLFHFVRRYQRVDPRHGCSRMRELARLWWHLRLKHFGPTNSRDRAG